jgi:hypothetical protein
LASLARSDIHVVFTDIQMPGSMDGLSPVRASPVAADLSQHRGMCGSATTICRRAACSCGNPIAETKSSALRELTDKA